jgi:hypothetical protein
MRNDTLAGSATSLRYTLSTPESNHQASSCCIFPLSVRFWHEHRDNMGPGTQGHKDYVGIAFGTLTIGWALGKLLKDKKMWRILLASCVLFLGLVELLPTLAVRAQEVQVEIVQPPMRFLTADTGLEDKKIEPSGVAPIGDGSLLLVACDKNACLSVVETATGRIKQSFSVGVFDNRPKWEDLAHDDEGAYYVIGSRFVEEPAEEGTQKRLMAIPRLLRFRLRSDGAGATPFVIDSESIVEWDIGDALAAEGYHRDPRKNEVNIEGLTVRTLRDKAEHITLRELVVGLRERRNRIRVYAANIAQLPAPNANQQHAGVHTTPNGFFNGRFFIIWSRRLRGPREFLRVYLSLPKFHDRPQSFEHRIYQTS